MVCIYPLIAIVTLLAPGLLAVPTSGYPADHTPIDKRTAQEVVAKLNLTTSVEKGYFVQTFQDAATSGCSNRSASTAIYYLLEGAVGYSNWHRVDAVEVWHYYAGAPLTLSLSLDDGKPARELTLGPDVFADQQPQVVIAGREWQRARSLGEWTLVGTTVAPGFVESGFEMASPGWNPA